jgi:hypothetical protein
MVKFKMLTCVRCVDAPGTPRAGLPHQWLPRKPQLPATCPQCNSPYWNRPRVNKKRAVVEKPVEATAEQKV